MKKLLLLEFNELSPVVIERFISQDLLPNLQRLRDGSRINITRTTDEELQPWVQWTTFHLGIPQSVHGVYSLDEGHTVTKDFIWDELWDRGIETLVFGAMNSNRQRPGVVLMPDAWSSKVLASNDVLKTLHSFAKLTVQEHTNPAQALKPLDIARYLAAFARNGLRIATVMRLVAQLIRERLTSQDLKWRRACLFDQMMWDVFRRCWSESQAEAAVFFANSTAFLQHRYWRSMEDDKFEVKPSAGDIRSYGDAILTGYQNMDRMVGEILDDPDLSNATIVLTTALSQHANPDRQSEAPHRAYRPHDFKKLLEWAAVKDCQSIEPLMTHLAWATFPSAEAASAGAEVVASIRIDRRQAFDYELHGNRVKFWCSVAEDVAAGARLCNRAGECVDFNETMNVAASSLIDGSHHRDGILWIRRPDQTTDNSINEIQLENAKNLVLESVLANSTVSGL